MAQPAGDLYLDPESLGPSNFELPPELSEWDRWRLAPGLAEIRQVMRREGLTFDEARLHLVRGRMAQIGADASGMPTDPKAFTFDSAPGKAAKPWRQSGEGAAGFGRQLPRGSAASSSRPSSREPKEFNSAGRVPADPWQWFQRSVSKAVKPTRGANVWLLLQALLLVVLGSALVVLRAGGWLSGSNLLPNFLAQEEVALAGEVPP